MEMKWFEGSIADAVATVKTKGAVFVVYSQGTDELSTAMTAALAKSQIAGQLQSESFVPIKLEGGSNAFQQFAQIYKFVPVPSVFFINTSGVPIEVVADGATEDVICTKLQTAITKSLATLSSGITTPMSTESVLSSPPSAPNVPVQEIPSTSSSSSNAVNTAVSPQPSAPATPSTSEATVPVPRTPPSEVTSTPPADPPASTSPQLSLDEKVKHAKELLEKKKAEAEAEERRKEKERELERRRTAHEIAMARKQQQERELREMMEERKRVKKEDADAKKKILEKIAEDRAERAARLATNEQLPQAPTPSTSSVPTPAPSPPPSNVNTARLQFKLPNGETKTHSFPADTTLGQVRQFIDNNIVIPFSDYQLATTFPRREFTRRDNDLDLRTLELIPSAVILIVPMHRSSLIPVGPGWSTAFIKMFWDALSPLSSAVRYLRNMIFGGGRSPPRDTTSTTTQQPQQATTSTRPTPYARERPPSGIRKRGNVHSLSNRDDDSNDENNTWNGNSTQQM